MNRSSFTLAVVVLSSLLVASPVMAQGYGDEAPSEPPENAEPEDEETDVETQQEDDESEETDSEGESDVYTEEEDAEQEELEIEGTDNSTSLEINTSEAQAVARNSLSEMDWMLEESSIEEEKGYYVFEFTAGTDSEADVRVDGSSGEVYRLEQEIEEDEVNNQTGRETAQNMKQARERISELRETIMELRKRISELESERTTDTEVEVERGPNRTEVEVENEGTEADIERSGNSTDIEVEGNEARGQGPQRSPGEDTGPQQDRNGTPGNEQASQNRPGFVNNLLSNIFG